MIAEALAAAAFVCPGPPAVLKERSAGALRTTLVTCQGRRRVVVRRARFQDRPRLGRRITVASRAGERIAWGEVRHRRGRVTGWVKVARIAGGRALPVHRRVVLRRGPAQLDVVMTTRGELAWLARWRIFTTTLRGRARLVTRDAWTASPSRTTARSGGRPRRTR